MIIANFELDVDHLSWAFARRLHVCSFDERQQEEDRQATSGRQREDDGQGTGKTYIQRECVVMYMYCELAF